MTSWIWMKGIDVAVADPIDPVCPDDDRQSVKALIDEHGEKITKIKEALVDDPLYDADKHDDLWILRFWLSHKKSQAAIDAAKYTLKFRKEHNLDDTDIRGIAPHQVKEGKVRDYLDCWGEDALIFTHPDPKRGVIAFLNIGSMDQHAVVERLTEDHWLPIFMYCSEWSFQWLDYVTRTTGRLTKSVRFVDMSGLTMSGFNRECSKRDGKVMGIMEDCYPQLLQTIFSCNPPIIMEKIFKLVRVLLPQRVIDKFDMVSPKAHEKDRKKFYRHISESDLPDFYGGKNPVLPQNWAAVVPEDEITNEVEI